MDKCIHKQTIRIDIGNTIEDVYIQKFFNPFHEFKFIRIKSINYINVYTVNATIDQNAYQNAYQNTYQNTYKLIYHNSDLIRHFKHGFNRYDNSTGILTPPIIKGDYEIKISFENINANKNGIIFIKLEFSN